MNEVITSGGLIPEHVAVKMQQDSVLDTGSTLEMTEENTQDSQQENQSTLRKVFVDLHLTFGLLGPQYKGNKACLSSVQATNTSPAYNLYSPLRKGKDGVAPGAVRSIWPSLLTLLDTINNSNVLLLGKQADMLSHLRSLALGLKTDINKMLPFTPETIVHQIQISDTSEVVDQQFSEPEVLNITFGDLVKVNTWVNMGGDSDVINYHTIVVNIQMNAGILYDSEKKFSYLEQIENFVYNTVKDDMAVRLAVNLNPRMMMESDIRDLFDYLVTTGGYDLYTKTDLQEAARQGGDLSWMPQSKAAVERDLLMYGGDILLIKHLTTKTLEEET